MLNLSDPFPPHQGDFSLRFLPLPPLLFLASQLVLSRLALEYAREVHFGRSFGPGEVRRRLARPNLNRSSREDEVRRCEIVLH